MKKLPPGKYPWVETVTCRHCKRMYTADYRQERDWSFCPDCTGEAGKRCLRVYDPDGRKTLAWDETAQEYR